MQFFIPQSIKIVFIVTALAAVTDEFTVFGQSAQQPGTALRKDAPAAVKRVGLFMPLYKAYFLTSGGIHEYSDSLTRLGKKRIVAQMVKDVHTLGYDSCVVITDTATERMLNQAYRLYEYVEGAVQRHVSDPDRNDFKITLQDGDFTVDSVAAVCAHAGVDALLIVEGFDEQKTNERKGYIIGTTISSMIVGGMRLRSDLFFLSTGLINKAGAVVWYNNVREFSDIDPVSDDLASIVEDLFKTFSRESE